MTTVYRLLCDPPAELMANPDSLYGTPRKGGLVFCIPRSGVNVKRLLTASPNGWGKPFEVPDDQLEPYRFDDVRSTDFPELIRYYLGGQAILPNFEQVPIEHGLDSIAAGGGMHEAHGGVQNVLLPGAERTTWARVFLNYTQGGSMDGTGLLVWYRDPFTRNKPEGSQIARFAICKHEKKAAIGANPNRGWHPGSCVRCGLNMTVDSSD